MSLISLVLPGAAASRNRGSISDVFGTFASPIDDVLGTNLAGRNATDRALAAQIAGRREADAALERGLVRTIGATNQSFDEITQMTQPYRDLGMRSVGQLANPNFGRNLQMDPGYQFRMQEGIKALEGSAAARGNLNSGRTLKELTRFGQDYASNEFNNAYERQYRRVGDLANIGITANRDLINASNIRGTNISNAYTGNANMLAQNAMDMANAQASAQIGQANRIAGLIGQGAAAYGYSQGRG